MKKVKAALTFSVFMFFLLCGTLSAGDGIYPNDAINVYDKAEKSSELLDSYTIRVLNDSYGGSFYVYNDESGNKYITNSKDILHKNQPVSITLKTDIRKGPVSSESFSENHVVIAELSDSDQYNDSESPDIEEKSIKGIPDPFEKLNRASFQFNDRLYFWFLKPVTKGYKAIVPETIRIGVKNFFENLGFPVRFVNCLFQGKVNSAAEELRLFVANTAIGMGGLLNFSGTLQIRKCDEDLGQTLGSYGINDGFFINWPFLGPSSLRDSVGLIGDSFLDPLNYMAPRAKYSITTKGLETVNETSFSLGDYEDLKKAALDPYVSYRNAYFQHRQEKIKE